MNLTDYQILNLVRAHPGLNFYRLRQIAAQEMPRWKWSIGKVERSVRRLEKQGKIETIADVVGGRACVIVRCKQT